MKDRWFNIPKMWDGESCYIIGGGYSLKNTDLSPLSSFNTIGCNDTFKVYDWIDILCFGDNGWYVKNRDTVDKFPGLVISNSVNTLKEPKVKTCRRLNYGIHTQDNWTLCWNKNTGAMAINLAVQLGAVKIFLLGYDMKTTDRNHNWYRDTNPVRQNIYKDRFIPCFDLIAERLSELNIECYNCNPDSALNCFPKIKLSDIL